MKLFTCTDFTGHYPVGTAAIVLAESIEDAGTLLLGYLAGIGLPQKHGITLTEVDITKAQAIVLVNGNY